VQKKFNAVNDCRVGENLVHRELFSSLCVAKMELPLLPWYLEYFVYFGAITLFKMVTLGRLALAGLH